MQVVHHVGLVHASKMVEIVELEEDCLDGIGESKEFSDLLLQLREPGMEFTKLGSAAIVTKL